MHPSTMQALAMEMEACKEEVFAGSEVLTWVRSGGAMDVASVAVPFILK